MPSFFYSFTHSVWGSTFIITVTGFSSAIDSWAPFSLVSLSSFTIWLYFIPKSFFFFKKKKQLAEAILTEPTTIDEIRPGDARTWPREQGERDIFLAQDLEDENQNEEAGLEVRSLSDFVTPPPTESRFKFARNDAIDIQDEDYEVISVEQETDRRINGVGRSDSKAIPSTLSSKAGIILVGLFF